MFYWKMYVIHVLYIIHMACALADAPVTLAALFAMPCVTFHTKPWTLPWCTSSLMPSDTSANRPEGLPRKSVEPKIRTAWDLSSWKIILVWLNQWYVLASWSINDNIIKISTYFGKWNWLNKSFKNPIFLILPIRPGKVDRSQGSYTLQPWIE